MKKVVSKSIILMSIIFMLVGTITGCTENDINSDNISYLTNNNTTENSNQQIDTSTISYRFADAKEGIQLRMQNDSYFNKLTQNDLDYRTGKIGATLEDFKELARKQGDTFTDEEKQVIADSIARIEERFKEIGFNYPLNSEIIFVKNKMGDEFGALAYTQGNQIYLESENLNFIKDLSDPIDIDEMIAHELFHILSRNNPNLRQAIYNVFGFTIADEPNFTPEIRNILASNPDVEKFDSYAMFNINGEMTKAVVVTILKNPYEDGQDLFSSLSPGIVLYDNPDKYYTIDQVSNFWEVFGENTGYVITTEEAIADNFASAIIYGMDGREYENPEIIEDILNVLVNYEEKE